MNIYFVRHGQTDWNLQKKLQGLADIPLNDTGKKQAKDLQSQLADKEIDLIITSPLQRAVETANIINEKNNLPIMKAEGLHERDFGEFEGLIKGEWYRDFWNWNKNLRYEKAENVQDFSKRINDELDNIITKYKGKNILIVAHGGVGIPTAIKFGSKEISENGDLLEFVFPHGEIEKFIID